ncbi:MAG: hypothetical protein JNM39_09705 [Bdellovibrionaceae bacterium]|nr:hypothetical protein [Pseudobdellovibrionaceae bacterium]
MGNLRLKAHPLEQEVDRAVQNLGGNLLKMKYVTDTGVSYYFNFGVEAEIEVYLALPIYVPTRPDNLFRLEFTVGDGVKAEDVGKILFAVTLDQDLQRYNVLRVVPRTKDHRSYKIVLQCVCAVDIVRDGFVASTILAGLETAEFYRTEFLTSQNKVA